MNIVRKNSNIVIFLISFMLTCFASTASALTPESGWWWNANESGRGFSIEIQDNTLFMAGFLYDESGAPFWFTSSGRFNASTSSFSADMQSFQGGQCFNCTYRRPTAQAAIGQLTLKFTSPTEGSLTWPFGTVAITRQTYGVGAGVERLLGSFAFSTSGNSGRVNFGNWLSFSRISNNATLGSVAEGVTEGGRFALATLTPDQRSVVILVDASSSFYELYAVPLSFFGTHGGFGLWATYAKTAAAPQPTAVAHFSRIFSSAEISATGAAAPSAKQPYAENDMRDALLSTEASVNKAPFGSSEVKAMQQMLMRANSAPQRAKARD